MKCHNCEAKQSWDRFSNNMDLNSDCSAIVIEFQCNSCNHWLVAYYEISEYGLEDNGE